MLAVAASLTLVCSCLSSLISFRLSPSFARSSRSCPTSSDFWAIQALIALSRFWWASINCGTQERHQVKVWITHTNSWFFSDTHRFIELFARLLSVYFSWEWRCGHSCVQSVDDAVVYGSHRFQHLLKKTKYDKNQWAASQKGAWMVKSNKKTF